MSNKAEKIPIITYVVLDNSKKIIMEIKTKKNMKDQLLSNSFIVTCQSFCVLI